MTNTENFNFELYEGADLFNPLTVENGNFEKVDRFLNMAMTLNPQKYQELYLNDVHNLGIAAGVSLGSCLLYFNAARSWTAGDTMKIDGNAVSVRTPAGNAPPTGAWVAGVTVCGYWSKDQGVFTVYVASGVTGDIDAKTLDGHDSSYFATAESVTKKADKSVASSVQLTVAGWQVSGSGYQQIVTVAQIDANTNLVVSPNANSFDAAIAAQIRATAQAQNQLTFYASSIPEQSVYMNIIRLS